MSGPEDKGKHYIALLDEARVRGAWTELPELIRKVTKHAANQKILINAATAEHVVATQASQRPQTASKASPDLFQTLKELVDNTQDTLSEETFQARTCLAWASWTGAGAGAGSGDFIHSSEVVPLFDRYGQKGTSTWTKICLLKAIYIQAQIHIQRGEELQAIGALKASTAWIELNMDSTRQIPQLAYWAEQILAALSTSTGAGTTLADRQNAFSLWSVLAAKIQGVAPSTYGNAGPTVARNAVWAAYYKLLSQTLENPSSDGLSRPQQAVQLRKVEAAYETAFLQNRKFPNATETNTVVEEWVEQVIHNWLILCGPGWSESDLGEGGRNAATRNVLDILYRAATKTFHSLLILRRLFQVHKSLTEFELAYRCLDTYIELADRARARAAKAEEASPESDEVILLTVAEGVEGLCSYGNQREAQRAFDLATKLEDWLDQIIPEDGPPQPNGHIEPEVTVNGHQARPLSDDVLQSICRAIGIAKAHYARWSPYSETRTELQAEALVALRRAASFAEPSLPTLYALALLCAETREITQALRWTKLALQKMSQGGADARAVASVKDQCAFWHLLTLLLSSQQDFDTAMQASAAMLDSILSTGLIASRISNSSRTESIGRHSEKPVSHTAADLECDDLQRLVELQTSYLALIELIDGPEAALNHSSELLSLYSTLFKRFEAGDTKQGQEQNFVPPKTSAGTVKSFKGSIFSRTKPTPSTVPSVTTTSLKSAAHITSEARPGTQASHAPTIQVTDETGHSPSRKHRSLLHRHHEHETSSKRLSKGARPGTAKSTKEDGEKWQSHQSPARGSQKTASALSDGLDLISPSSKNHDSQPEAKQPLGDVPHNVTSHEKAPPPLGHTDQPPEQDVRLPTVHSETSRTSPIPRFPKAQAQKHALVVLNKIWISVATLYRRAHIFEDAREAIEEAAKCASKIESIVSLSDSSARVLAEAGWGGGGKSSDEVWADVCCARAELLHAVANRRAEEGTPTTSEMLREIVDQYENCLMYFPDHPNGIIGLSNMLLDYYERKIDLGKKVDDGRSLGIKSARRPRDEDVLGPATPSPEYISNPFSNIVSSSGEDLRKTPENLNRIAARDRAYGLLSTLTKLGNGWDNSAAWFALTRAQELGGEVDKAKKILWWCIELEDTRPIRHWRNLGCGGYVL